MGGFFTTFGAQAFERIVKIKDDGTPVSPLIFPGAAGFDGDVRAIAQSLDGRGLIYAGGNFTTFDGSPAGYFKVIDEKDLNEPTARVTAVSTPEPDNTVGTPLNVGGNIFTLRVEFDQAVVVTGTPIVVLNTSTPGNVVVAQYVSGSGNNVLNFEYTLFSGQSTGSRELSYLDEHSLILNGGTISTADTGDAVDLRLPKVGDTGSFTANHNIFVNVP